MDSKLAKAILKRTTALSRLKESFAVAQESKTDPSKVILLSAYYEDLQDVYRDFSSAHNSIIGLIEDNENSFKEQDIVRSEGDKLYYGIKAIYNASVQSFTITQTASQTSTHSAKLPKISIPTFDGNFKSWPTFFDLYNSLIHNNAVLTNIEKFHYLSSSLSKDPLSLVNTIPMTADNYTIAYDILVKRYHNKRYLATRYWAEIVDVPMLQRATPKELRKLLDIFSENLSAMQVLGFPVDQWDFVLLNLLVGKLDVKTRTDFEVKVSKVELPSYTQLYQFLENYCHALESVQIQSPSTSKSQQISKPTTNMQKSHASKAMSSFTASSVQERNSPQCLLCDIPHPLYRCPNFAAKSVAERFDFVKQKNLCINCLSSSHLIGRCNSKMACRVCRARHHSFLHRDSQINNSSPLIPTESNVQQVSLNASTMKGQGHTVMLATAMVEIKDALGNFHSARVMFDSGSMANFITRDCLRRLKLPYARSVIPIEGLNNSVLSATQGITKCCLRSRTNPFETFDLETIVLPKICANQPKHILDLSQWSHINRLRLADDKCHIPGPIDLLIGAELIPYIIQGHKVFGSLDQPVAISSKFGWILQGKATFLNSCQSALYSFHASFEHPSLETLMQQFWQIESVPLKPHVSLEDARCESIYKSSVTRMLDGRFVVTLPFRDREINFGDTYRNTLRRFLMLEKRLLQNAELHKEYCAFMKNYLDSKYMSLVPPHEVHSATAYYIPHHCVMKLDSSTTRLRVVFDASAKGSSGVSLNDVLLTGPKLQTDIVSILLNFRKYAIALTSDIKQMYLQIHLASKHRDYQRILWRFSADDPLLEYSLNTVTFGLSSSPFLALRTVAELAEAEEKNFPLAVPVVRKNIYVDDVVTGASTLDEAITLRDQLIGLFKAGGFELRKWASNQPLLLENVSDAQQTFIDFDKDEPSYVKVLGLKWSPVEDVFSYSCHPVKLECSKRNILSGIARIYDPLGFLSPVILFAKELMQRLWSAKCGWDDVPPPKICNAWTQFNDELTNLAELKIPRYMYGDSQSRLELHGFSDASQLGYAAVVYLRVEHGPNNVSTFLCYAKSKVAPVKTVSLPRLELLGAVLLTNLVSKFLDIGSFKVDHIYTWTDSEIVLAWLSSEPNRWKTFVANRVAHIHETLPSAQWRYVPSKENPADCASRGLLPSALRDHSLWWHGPPWLVKVARPVQPAIVRDPSEAVLEEAKLALTVTIEPHIFHSLLNRFSSLRKVKRVLGFVVRFVSNINKNRVRLSGEFSLAEMTKVLLILIKHVQAECFDDVLCALHRQKIVPKPLRKLNPFLDDQGLLRVGGRLGNSNLDFAVKHPLLLPTDHVLTQLIISEAHSENLHPGFQTLSNILLQQYWILSPRRAINRCLSRCYRCFKAKPKPLMPMMGNLPPCRINQLRAFLAVCLDFAGPFQVTPFRARGMKSHKSYVCVFVCCSTRAIHLELVNNLASESFLMAFQRFISRRGRCLTIHSDQGTNFVGANKILNELACQASAKLEIDWKFNPPSAPHFNGLAEAGVKSLKTHLNRVIGDQILSVEEFSTLLTKIEGILNSRPLSPLSSDPNDVQPLTPAHFLLLEPLGSDFPEPNLSNIPLGRLNRFQLLSRMVTHFWDRWRLEYLNTLQQRSKWTSQPDKAVRVGSLVIIKNDNEPPKRWSLGRIVEVHPGKDGVIRVATVLTAVGKFQRPLVKLCPLPFSD